MDSMRRALQLTCSATLLLMTSAFATSSDAHSSAAATGSSHPLQPPRDATAIMATFEAAQTPVQSEFDALTLPQLMAKLRVPGLSIAVVKDHKIHWAKGYGVADAASHRLVDVHTRFQAASLSKPLAALTAMRLVRDGQLNVDTDINRYLTTWKVPRSSLTGPQAVTARALLSHTSGADDGFGFPGYEPGAALPTVAQILDGHAPSNVGKVLFTRPPLKTFKYSGGGALVMQQAMMDICRCAFEQLVQRSVLTPLNMTDSSYTQALDGGNVALAHDEQGQRKNVPWHQYPELAAASLWTTPTDLAKVIIELQQAESGTGKVLDRQSATQMLTPVGVGRYGLGWVLDVQTHGVRFSHNGSNWGYRAWMLGHSQGGYGVVIMANGDNGMALLNQVADRLFNAYGWQ